MTQQADSSRGAAPAPGARAAPLHGTLLGSDTTLLPGALALARAAAPELPQKDDLCGPFWALASVRAAGITGSALSQDHAAAAAGTRLWAGPEPTVPPGMSTRRDYVLDLPSTTDLDAAGTDAEGVERAIRELSGGALTGDLTVDRITEPPGGWNEHEIERVLSAVSGETDTSAHAVVAVIVNVATEAYLLPKPDVARTQAEESYLATGDASSFTPVEWSAGHFAALLGWRDGPGGRLYLVHDTYPLMAEPGTASDAPEAAAPEADAPRSSEPDQNAYVHAQPAAAFAAALRREGRSPGRILVVRRQLRRPITGSRDQS